MRRFLLILSALGSLIFGGAVWGSYFQPIWIESAARAVVRIEVEKRMGEKLDQLSNSRIAGIAQKIADKTQLDISKVEQDIRNEVPRKIAEAVANMTDANCECRKRLIQFSEDFSKTRLSTLTQFKERLTTLIEHAYSDVSRKLLSEFRIFCSANALVFALLGLVTLLKRQASLQLLIPAAILIGAALLTGGLYLFSQNWLHTIVFSDYVGWSYFSYLSAAIALFGDVLLNRARASTWIFNGLSNIMGAAISAVPC